MRLRMQSFFWPGKRSKVGVYIHKAHIGSLFTWPPTHPPNHEPRYNWLPSCPLGFFFDGAPVADDESRSMKACCSENLYETREYRSPPEYARISVPFGEMVRRDIITQSKLGETLGKLLLWVLRNFFLLHSCLSQDKGSPWFYI